MVHSLYLQLKAHLAQHRYIVLATTQTLGLIKLGATNCESGFVDEAVTDPVPLNWRASPFVVGISAVVTGTVNYTLQHSFDDPQDGGEAMTWHDHDISDMVSVTATANGNYSASVRASRIKINSYSAGAAVKTTWIQGQGGN